MLILVAFTVSATNLFVVATTDSVERLEKGAAVALAAANAGSLAGEETAAAIGTGTILGAAAITGSVVGGILVLPERLRGG